MTSCDHLQVKDALITHGVTLGSFDTRGVGVPGGDRRRGIMPIESDVSEAGVRLWLGASQRIYRRKSFRCGVKNFRSSNEVRNLFAKTPYVA